jgi:hypothetical protein
MSILYFEHLKLPEELFRLIFNFGDVGDVLFEFSFFGVGYFHVHELQLMQDVEE